MKTAEILRLKLDSNNDAWAADIGEYLSELLMLLWQEGESFSPKRPFGESDWQYHIYQAIIEAGLVDGNPLDMGRSTVEKVDALICACIREALCGRVA